MRAFLFGTFLFLGFHFEAAAQISAGKEIEIVKPAAKASRSFLIGAELRHYTYDEPGFVQHTGLLYGFWGEWYWSSGLGNGKLYGNAVFGTIDYDGSRTDTNTGVTTEYKAKTDDIIAKVASRFEFKLNKSFQLFAGGGYRYYRDMGQGSSFYLRSGQGVFIPVGAEVNFNTSVGRFYLEAEYDQVVWAQIKSNLSEAVSSYPDLTLAQTGYGMVLAAGYKFNPDWMLQVLYEKWHLNESESSGPVTTSQGTVTFNEPENDATSFGLRLGYLF